MSLNPDVQERAQAELDAVVGPHRLPTYQDRASLPYLNAVLKECLRWHNVTPFGNPRCTQEDTEYRGYFIPKGTTLLANAWHVLALLSSLVLPLMGLGCPHVLQGLYARPRGIPGSGSLPPRPIHARRQTGPRRVRSERHRVRLWQKVSRRWDFCRSQTPFTQSSILAELSRIGYVPDGASQRWRCLLSSRWSSTYSTSLRRSMRPGNLSSSNPDGGDRFSCEYLCMCSVSRVDQLRVLAMCIHRYVEDCRCTVKPRSAQAKALLLGTAMASSSEDLAG